MCVARACAPIGRGGGEYIHYDICVFSIILVLLVFVPLLPPLPLVLPSFFYPRCTTMHRVRCGLILTR